MTTITIRQYVPSASIELAPEALSALIAGFANRIEIRSAPAGGFTLTGTNHVGVIRVDDLDVIVQPKIPPLSVLWMLGFVAKPLKVDPSDFPFDVEPGLLDVLARLFARQTELVIRRGLYREYVECDENLRFVRGRVVPLDDLRANQGLHHQVVCRYAELTSDVLHNRILRTVTELLLRFWYRLLRVREWLAWDAAHLAEVSAPPIGERDLAALRYGRLNAHYEAVHGLARLILSNLTFHFAAGTQMAPSFLLNMDDIYESFVRRLAEDVARPMGLRLRAGERFHLDEGGRVVVNPDVVMVDGQRTRIAIDAKYKRKDPEADVYQALAYAKALGLRRVALLYPAGEAVEPTTHRIRNDETAVFVRTIPVGHGGAGFADLEQRAELAMRALLEELLGQHASEAAA